MDSAMMIPTNPTNILTFLFGQADTHSFEDGYNSDPAWFSPELLLLVSAQSPSSRCLTFRQLKHSVRSLASGFQKKGLHPGDRVLVISPESIYLPVMLLAAIAAGGVFMGLVPNYTAGQQANTIKQYEPTFVIAYKGLEGVATQAARIADLAAQIFYYDDNLLDPNPPPTHELGNSTNLSELLDEANASLFHWRTLQTHKDAETTALIVFTTGTTSGSKGVELTHKSLLTSCTNVQYFVNASEHQEDWIHNFSTAFFGGAGVFLGALKSRNRLIVYDLPTINHTHFLNSIILHKCRVIWATKPAIDLIIVEPPRPDNLSLVTTLLTGGTDIPSATRQAVNTFFGKPVLRVIYASSETGGAISIEPRGAPLPLSTSVGKLLPHIQAKILNDVDGTVIHTPGPPSGTLHFKTPAGMKTYFGNPTATAAALSPDGWINSGDIGYFDEEGMLHLSGRVKEVLKMNGRSVTTAGIEETLMQMPGVEIVCVVGVRKSEGGDDLSRAYVVRKTKENDDHHDDDGDRGDPKEEGTNESAVHAFMRKHMSADHELTGGVVFVDREWLPYGVNGKVLRREVQKRAQVEHDGGI